MLLLLTTERYPKEEEDSAVSLEEIKQLEDLLKDQLQIKQLEEELLNQHKESGPAHSTPIGKAPQV
ncbi:hypothetical protein ACF0H5_010600 [Mactra antiquata]